MTTGGVSVTNARELLDAGACCSGAGDERRSRRLLAAGEYGEVTRRAKQFKRAVKAGS